MASTHVASAALLALLLALLLAVPFIWGSFTAYQLGLFLLYGMVAQGIALCWGRTGFLPLGQALFFGLGAYIAGWGLKASGGSWTALVPVLALAVLVPAALAGLIGILLFDRRAGSGHHFTLITLALTMLGSQLAYSLDWLTGGFNGMVAIPGLPGIDSYRHLYFVIVVSAAAVTLLLAGLLRSPFGIVLSAIRQNEDRLQFFGFRTGALKALAFAISAGLAGFAGALFAPHQGIVTPEAVGLLLSAEFVIWTAVGGRSSLLGPPAGAILIGYLSSVLRDTFVYWEIVVAIVFIAVVLRFPEGLAGIGAPFLRRPKWAHRREPRDIELPAQPRPCQKSLEFRDVHVDLGGVRILNGLSLAVSRPGVHCIIGPNGAGKTTAFNALSGRLAPTGGDILWGGCPIGGRRPFEVARLGIGRKFQVPSVFPEATVGDNIDIALWANRISFSDMLSRRPYRWTTPVLDRLRQMFPFLDDPARLAASLSLGERQMLEFAMTNLAEPQLILLDEPCAGLSTQETAHMIAAIAALQEEFGASALIIEHDMEVVERLADHIYVLHLGTILAEGSIAEIRANAAVQAIYAGGSK